MMISNIKNTNTIVIRAILIAILSDNDTEENRDTRINLIKRIITKINKNNEKNIL